jgi:hypothetical protein
MGRPRREGRREERRARVVEAFGEEGAGHASDLLELLELAWHDCYAEVTSPGEVVEDVLVHRRHAQVDVVIRCRRR